MKLSVTSWSFPACTLPEVAGIAKALGIPAVDVGYFYASALDKTGLLADPEGTAARLADQGIYQPLPLPPVRRHARRPQPGRPALARAQPRRLRAGGRLLPRGRHPDRLRPARRLQPRPGPRGGAARVRRLAAKHSCDWHRTRRAAHRRAPRPRLPREPEPRAPAPRAGPRPEAHLDYAHFVCLGYRQEDVDVLAPRRPRPPAPGPPRRAPGQGPRGHDQHGGRCSARCATPATRGWLALEYVHQDYMGRSTTTC